MCRAVELPATATEGRVEGLQAGTYTCTVTAKLEGGEERQSSISVEISGGSGRPVGQFAVPREPAPLAPQAQAPTPAIKVRQAAQGAACTRACPLPRRRGQRRGGGGGRAVVSTPAPRSR